MSHVRDEQKKPFVFNAWSIIITIDNKIMWRFFLHFIIRKWAKKKKEG